MEKYNVPILLICFKRYDKTLEVLNSIKQIKPSKLYVSIDGARNEKEKIEVDKVASIFDNYIDWNCKPIIRKNRTNQGCKYGVYNAINWFFEHEEMGVILEDDIVPYQQFYPYCEELLIKYKDDKRIGAISGWSYFYNKEPNKYDYTYYFSHIQSSWGWATWRDRWDMIDLDLKNVSFEEIEKKLLNDNVSKEIINFYKFIYNKKWCFDTTWDYQFLLSVLMKNNMYCIQPIKRFVKNIGDIDGTHPTLENLNKSKPIGDDFKMNHPPKLEYIPELDFLRNSQTNEYIKEKNITILFDSQIYDLQQFGGISRMYVDLYNEINKGQEFNIKFSVEKTNNIYLSKTPPYEFGNVNNRELSKNMIKEGNYDIFYPTFFSTYFLEHLKGKPFVMSVHDMIPELYPQFFKKNDMQIVGKREMVKYASAIEVPTETTKRDLIRLLNVDESKIYVIGRGIEDDFGEKTLEKNIVDYKYILYVGQRNAYKRFDWFIKHISSFLNKHLDIKLLCTGNDFSDNEKKLFEECGVTNKVISMKVNDIELATLYKNAEFFVYTSEYEGFGLPILESYKMNCIALLNNNDCFKEVTFGNGTFFNLKENESDICDVMEKILSLKQEEKEKILSTQKEILSHYSIKKTSEKLKNMFRKALNNDLSSDLDLFICTHKEINPIVKNKVYKQINCNDINNDTWNGLQGSFYSEIMSYAYIAENYKLKKYIGFCHYRKYFGFLDNIPNLDGIFKEFDAIVAEPIINKRETIKEQYARFHNIEDLYIVGGILADKYPDYSKAWHSFINGNLLIPYNMFIMKREDFKEYISFIFNILDEYVKVIGTNIAKRITDNKEKYLKNFYPNNTIEYQYRIGGYLAERLTNVFLIEKYTRMKTYEVIITEDKYKKKE